MRKRTIKTIAIVTLIATMLTVSSMFVLNAHATVAGTFHFRAYIDGADYVYIQNAGGKVWYEHISYDYPGEHDPYSPEEPAATTLDGVDWFPVWDYEEKMSDTYVSSSPESYPSGDWTAIGITKIYSESDQQQSRGPVTIVDSPSISNDYTAKILIDDDTDEIVYPGAAWYEFELSWEAPMGNVPPGEDVTVNPDPDVILTFDNVTTGGDATVEKSDLPPEGVHPLPGIKGPYFNISVTALFEGNVLVGIRYDDTGMSRCQERRLRLCIYTGEDPIGDVNHDGIVDLKDICRIMLALGTVPGAWRWNPACDLNNDLHVNFKDLYIALKNLGQSSWKDITQYVDIVNDIVYGETDHFSIFGAH